MNGVLAESTVVKKYGFSEPLIHKINSIIDTSIKDCNIRYYPTFEYK